LGGFQAGQGLVHGRQQPKHHTASEPKTKFMRCLCVQANQQAVLNFIVADGQLVDLHFLILGNKAQLEPLENGQQPPS
jgi:hypothetical protein